MIELRITIFGGEKMYKTSSQLKAEAKEALKGRWKDAVFLNIVPSVLNILAVWGVLLVLGISLVAAVVFFENFESSSQTMSQTEQFEDLFEDGDTIWDDEDNWEDQNEFSVNNEFSSSDFLDGVASGSTSVNFVLRTGFSVILSFLTIGISFTFLEVLRNPRRQINPSNDQFRMFNGRDFVPLVLIQLLSSFFIYLWSLLFVIPGIVKGYAYSQSFFIYKDLSEHTDTQGLSANNYITESKLMMQGHKGRLFYIDLSFIGWTLLSWATLGLGYLFLNPYRNLTKAAFYRDLSKDRYTKSGESAENPEIVTEADEWTSF